MSVQMNHEAGLFLFCMGTGMLLSAIYSILSIFRQLNTHNKILYAIGDLLFWITSGFFFFFEMYQKNDGVVRIYVLAAGIIGVWIWWQMIRPLYTSKVLKILKLARNVGNISRKWLLNRVKSCKIHMIKCMKRLGMLKKRDDAIEREK